MISENAKYWIMLTQAIGYNTPKMKKLAERYPDIAVFFEGGIREWKRCGFFSGSDLEKLSAAAPEDAEVVLDRCRYLGYSVLTIDDDSYPDCLYRIYAPPAVLYIDGALPDLDNQLTIGVVGTRRASRYGTENSYKIAYSLCKYNVIIISGGALGVDCASHRGALAANGVTVCVRGCGINSRYLPDNAHMRRAITRKGAVISEYPPDEEPKPYYFPARNRIIAALSDGVLVIEAGEKSGSLITANLALESGKELFALMGNNHPQNKGSNERIKEGTAIPVTDFMDILSAFDRLEFDADDLDYSDISMADIAAIPVKRTPSGRKAPPEASDARLRQTRRKHSTSVVSETKTQIELRGDAKRVFDYLGTEPVHIDTIAGDLGLPVNTTLSTLTFLEMNGLIRVLQGRYFALK